MNLWDGSILRAGAVAGIIGSVCYTIFVEIVNVVANGWDQFFYPFRQIGAIVIGSRALRSDFDVLTATAAGATVHFLVAALFGIALAQLFARLSVQHLAERVAAGLSAGLALYVLNVFVIFPLAFPWFLENSRITQSFGHALFGAATGFWLYRLNRQSA